MTKDEVSSNCAFCVGSSILLGCLAFGSTGMILYVIFGTLVAYYTSSVSYDKRIRNGK